MTRKTPSNSKPLHPAWLRITHWLSFYTLLVMFWSGMLIYWAYPVYKISVGGNSFRIVPKPVFAALGMEFRLAEGMAYHFNFMWILMGVGFVYLVLSLVQGNWRNLFPTLSDFRGVFQMMLFTFGFRKEAPAQGKYNPAQKMAYFTSVFALILVAVSGWAIYKPARLWFLTSLFGGYENARAVHFIATAYLFLFFIVHVVQVIRAGWTNFSAMVTGGETES